MFRVPLLLCIVPAFSIIIIDPLPSPNDYKYSYEVQNPATGDSKSQHEVRQGDTVTGAYTVVGPDGIKRMVEYTADAENGFNAVITEEFAPPPPHVPCGIHIRSGSAHDQHIIYSTVRPLYVPVYKLQPRKYVKDRPIVYFTPENEIEPRKPFSGGNHFIPAN